ncbi:Lipoprotein [Myxococcus xanthus]|nr:hypothetical protein MyxoNM_12930 [Myxococcus xanthus]SDW98203.1 hypothetical protein SAMN05444383_104443 [Myxococcus xanthus]
MRAVVFAFVVALMSSGCGSGALSAIRGKAAQDMACPEKDLAVNPVHDYAGAPNESGAYYAEGCQKLRRYEVGCNAFGYCPDPHGVDIQELILRQAAFDLKCEQDSISTQRLNRDTFGARGCDQQASYILLCSRSSCRVVQNTQSQ